MPIPSSQKRQPWPYHAKESRDRCAELALKGSRALEPVIEGTVKDETEKLRRVSIASFCCASIALILKGEGAEIEP